MNQRLLNRTLLAVLLAIVFPAGAALAQTTTFTYQGRLSDGGTAANGNYDLQFALWDSPSGGAQIGLTQTAPAVAVSNGIFTLTLDFGSSVFSGANRFLEISVRPVGTASFTTLIPREQIGSTPYAIRTLSAASADTATTATNATQLGGIAAGQYVQTTDSRLSDSRPPTAGSSNYVQNAGSAQSATFNISGNGTIGGTLAANGNVGIGTSSPLRTIQIGASPDAAFTISPRDVTPNAGFIRFGDNTGWKLHFARSRESSGGGLNTGTSGLLMTIQDNGDIGVGTANPQTKLDVRGDVKLGSTGQFFATGGDENLRIIRGGFNAAGNIALGSGFTVSVNNLGGGSFSYDIHFNTPFSGTPAVTANCEAVSASDICVAETTLSSAGFGHIVLSVPGGNSFIDGQVRFIAIGPR